MPERVVLWFLRQKPAGDRRRSGPRCRNNHRADPCASWRRLPQAACVAVPSPLRGGVLVAVRPSISPCRESDDPSHHLPRVRCHGRLHRIRSRCLRPALPTHTSQRPAAAARPHLGGAAGPALKPGGSDERELRLLINNPMKSSPAHWMERSRMRPTVVPVSLSLPIRSTRMV